MPNDKVQIEYGVVGTNEAAAQVKTLNEAIRGTGTEASKASADTEDIGAGIGGLATAVSTVNPQLGALLGQLEAVKFVSTGVEGGVTNVKAALGGLATLLANPYFIGAAAVFAGISMAVKSYKKEQEDANREAARFLEIQKEQAEVKANARAGEDADSGDALQRLEPVLAAAGLPASNAISVGQSAAKAAKASVTDVDDAIAEAIRSIQDTGQIPSTQDLTTRLSTRALKVPGLKDLSGLSTQEIDTIAPTLSGLSDRRIQSLQGSFTQRQLAGETDEVSAALQSRTIGGVSKRLGEDELARINTAPVEEEIAAVEGRIRVAQGRVDAPGNTPGFYSEGEQSGNQSELARLNDLLEGLQQTLANLNERRDFASAAAQGNATYSPQELDAATQRGAAQSSAPVNYYYYGTNYVGGENGNNPYRPGQPSTSPNRILN